MQKAAANEEEILSDPEVKLVCGAAVTNLRCALGLRVMAAGKDYFIDKTPLTSLEQLAQAKEMVSRTGKKYMCYYSERIHVEAAMFCARSRWQQVLPNVMQCFRQKRKMA